MAEEKVEKMTVMLQPGGMDMQELARIIKDTVCAEAAKLDRGRSRSRSHSSDSRDRSASRRGYNPKGRYCYHHYKFRERCHEGKCREPCAWKSRTAVNSAADSAKPTIKARNSRLFIKDRTTSIRFLVDSGADVSIIPASANDKVDDSVILYAANNTRIETCGIKILTVDLGLRRTFQWPFIVAKITKGILGADFMKYFNLLIDLYNSRLVDGITNLTVRGNVEEITEGDVISTMDKNHRYYELLKQYPELTKPNLLPVNLKHDVKHHIETKGEPVYSRARPLDPKRMEVVKAEFEYMLDNGIIRPSSSEWASPLHVVTKPDGSLRPCGDYRSFLG